MTSADDLEEHEHEYGVPRPRSPTVDNTKHSRTTSTSVDFTPSLSQSRNRTPLGSRRGSRELPEYPLVKNGKSSRSRLSHEVNRSSLSIDLSDSNGETERGFAEGSMLSAEQALHASLSGLQDEAAHTNGHSSRQSPNARPKPARKNKHEGTAEKAGVILVSLVSFEWIQNSSASCRAFTTFSSW